MVGFLFSPHNHSYCLLLYHKDFYLESEYIFQNVIFMRQKRKQNCIGQIVLFLSVTELCVKSQDIGGNKELAWYEKELSDFDSEETTEYRSDEESETGAINVSSFI